MRRIIINELMSLDGVIQGPGGPQEDSTNGFALGGWSATQWDETMHQIMTERMQRDYDLLLGRFTYDIWAAYWPFQNNPVAAKFNRIKKVCRYPNPAGGQLGEHHLAEWRDGRTGKSTKRQRRSRLTNVGQRRLYPVLAPAWPDRPDEHLDLPPGAGQRKKAVQGGDAFGQLQTNKTYLVFHGCDFDDV
jgi:hypothetical protein